MAAVMIGRTTCAVEACVPVPQATAMVAAEGPRCRKIRQRQRAHIATGRRSSHVACSTGNRAGPPNQSINETTTAIEAAADSLQYENEDVHASYDDNCPSWTEVAEMNLGVSPFAEPIGKGLVRDIRKRLIPHFVSDITDGLNMQTLASSLFLCVACLSNAVTFGVGAAVVTAGQIGPVEMILSTSICGAIYALTCGQPVALTGFGGAHLAFTGVLYSASTLLGVEFLPFFAWVGIWASLFLMVLTLTSASNLVLYFTRFTDETFSALSSVIFVYESTRNLVKPFLATNPDAGASCLGMLMGLLTAGLVIMLTRMKKSGLFTKHTRSWISDFAPTLSMTLTTFLSMYLCTHLNVVLPALSLPVGIATSTGRPWLVDIWSLSPQMIAFSTIPAIMLTTLLFMDQVITTRLVNTPDNALRKGWGYHLDLGIIALYTGACSVVGLPWMTAATVPSLNHARSLSNINEEGDTVSLIENRVSAFLIHVLMGVSLLGLRDILQMVPQPAFMGLFLFLGLSAASNNKFLKRCVLLVTDPTVYHKKLPKKLRKIRPLSIQRSSISKYTLAQLGCLVALWGVKSMQGVGIVFPLLIAFLVPARILLGKYGNLPRSSLKVCLRPAGATCPSVSSLPRSPITPLRAGGVNAGNG